VTKLDLIAALFAIDHWVENNLKNSVSSIVLDNSVELFLEVDDLISQLMRGKHSINSSI
jgi:hypothetical protein